MSLATKCPQCHTTFKVAPDQLKLRSGHVRCGTCGTVFNALASLLPLPNETRTPNLNVASNQSLAPSDLDFALEQNVASHTSAVKTQAVAQATSNPLSINSISDKLVNINLDLDSRKHDENHSLSASAVAKKDEIDHFPDTVLIHDGTTHLDPQTDFETDSINLAHQFDQPDALDKLSIAGLHTDSGANHIDTDHSLSEHNTTHDVLSATHADTEKYDHTAFSNTRWTKRRLPRQEDPDFIKQAKHKERLGEPAMRIVYVGAAVLLLSALLAQALYFWRAEIAANWPNSKPIIENFCKKIHCKINLPQKIDSIVIEGAELQKTSVPNQFQFIGSLKNKADYRMTAPHLELTLTDTAQQVLVRRTFSPQEYLSNSVDGLDAAAEQAVQLHFAFTPDTNANSGVLGFRAYVFYP